ncbi:hypothetical protein HY993_01440 [Candidatus Micrarchaeota archaeon]|nr:hypothetical protein [Candidatus Micrarchaeota archaeon]
MAELEFKQILLASSVLALFLLYALPKTGSASLLPIELANASAYLNQNVFAQGKLTAIKANSNPASPNSALATGLLCAQKACLKTVFTKNVNPALLPKKGAWLKARGKISAYGDSIALYVYSSADYEAS